MPQKRDRLRLDTEPETLTTWRAPADDISKAQQLANIAHYGAAFTYLSSIDLLRTGDCSDLTIDCEGKSYRVHKAIICSKSSHFRFFIGGGAYDRIELRYDDRKIIQAMLDYIYTANYDVAYSICTPFKSKIRIKDEGEADEEEQIVEEPSNTQLVFPHSCELQIETHPTTGDLYMSCSAAPLCSHHQCPDDCGLYGCWYFVCGICGPEEARKAKEEEAKKQVPVCIFHAHVYTVAVKYAVLGLKELSMERFDGILRQYWDTDAIIDAVDEVFAADLGQDAGLKQAVIRLFNEPKHTDVQLNPKFQELMARYLELRDGLLDSDSDDSDWQGVEGL